MITPSAVEGPIPQTSGLKNHEQSKDRTVVRERGTMENFFLGRGVPCAPLRRPTFVDAAARRRARGRSRPCRGRRAPRRCPRRGRGPTRLLTSPSRPRRRGAIQGWRDAARRRLTKVAAGPPTRAEDSSGKRSGCAGPGAALACAMNRAGPRARSRSNFSSSSRTSANEQSLPIVQYLVLHRHRLVVVGQWGGAGGAVCEDHLINALCGPWNVKCEIGKTRAASLDQ